jgi:uncharacterized membrane-anchored protein YhcB (DUF1043 family)
MGYWDKIGIKFKKNGTEVKQAIALRLGELQKRLDKRNKELEEIMEDKARLRSYLVRDPNNDYPHSAQLKQELPTEDHQKISELCKRICLIEKEIKRLTVTKENVKDDQEFELDYEELTGLGFGLRDGFEFS